MWSELTREEIEGMLNRIWWEHAPRQIRFSKNWRERYSRWPTIVACDRACGGGYETGCRGGCGLRDVRLTLRTTPVKVVRRTVKKKEVPDLPF
jgi:hypothetical protein